MLYFLKKKKNNYSCEHYSYNGKLINRGFQIRVYGHLPLPQPMGLWIDLGSRKAHLYFHKHLTEI